MRRFAETAEAVSKTSSRLKKVQTLADYLQDLSDPDLHAASIFFTGRPFPLADARTLNVGGAALVRVVLDLAGATEEELGLAYLDRGDLGEAARRLLPPSDHSLFTPSDLLQCFERLAAA